MNRGKETSSEITKSQPSKYRMESDGKDFVWGKERKKKKSKLPLSRKQKKKKRKRRKKEKH